MPLAEKVVTAVFSRQMLLPTRWSYFAVAGGDTIVLRVVLLIRSRLLLVVWFLWNTISRTQTIVIYQ